MMFTLVFLLLIVQLFYYLFFYINFNKEENNRNNYPSISIIICAKNEAKNLQKNIPKLATQHYSNFEIIVVDDNSDDETPIILEQLKHEIPNLKLIKINNNEKIGKGKKYLIYKAVEFSENEVLVFTDADCFPASEKWLQIMANHLQQHEIVLGIAPLIKIKNNFIGQLQMYETAQTLLQYISLAKAGNPYMAVGRNMMLKKTIFLQNIWTKEALEIASGDDDLLVQKIATAENTNTCTNSNAFMFSNAKANYADWKHQKTRHYSAGFLYKNKDKIILSAFLFSKALFYILCLFDFGYLRLLLIYLAILTLVYKAIENKYKIETSWKRIFILDIFLIFNNIFLGLKNQFKVSNKWK